MNKSYNNTYYDNVISWKTALDYILFIIVFEIIAFLCTGLLEWILAGNALLPQRPDGIMWSDIIMPLIWDTILFVLIECCFIFNQYRIIGDNLYIVEKIFGSTILSTSIPIECIEDVTYRRHRIYVTVGKKTYKLWCISKSKALYNALQEIKNNQSK